MKSLRNTICILLTVAIALPVACMTLQFVAGLLEAMKDAPGALVVRGVATAFGAVWPVVLVGLLIAVALKTWRDE